MPNSIRGSGWLNDKTDYYFFKWQIINQINLPD